MILKSGYTSRTFVKNLKIFLSSHKKVFALLLDESFPYMPVYYPFLFTANYEGISICRTMCKRKASTLGYTECLDNLAAELL